MERDETTMVVARNIEALMKERGTDAAKLARAAKLGPTGIYDILKGKSRSPSIKTIGKIAAALGVPTMALFEENLVPDLRLDLIRAFESLGATERELLLQTARAWIENRKSA